MGKSCNFVDGLWLQMQLGVIIYEFDKVQSYNNT